MTSGEVQAKLSEFLSLPAETEWVEFKEAKNGYDFDDLGKYFSALSNEANLKGQAFGWLVLGVKDKPIPRPIVGSQFRPQRPHLDSLKQEIAVHTSHHLTFEEIHEVTTPDGRVVIFQIPAALRGFPTSWKGHYYGRDHEAIGALNPHEYDQIRRQVIQEDWSAQVCEGATLDDLDPQAIGFALQEYQKKHPSLAAEAKSWSPETFLNKAKLCIGGRITRAAILLLGRNESEHFLSPAISRITWVLKDQNGVEKDYQHFGPPLILAVDAVFAKVRNLTYRYLPNASLFPTEVTQYEPWVIREALHNAIAHQDYPQGGRISLVESPDDLLFTNVGSFLPGSVEEVIRRDAPPDVYPNRFLAEAMVNLNMIDTIGSGIKRMFKKQRDRFFPMPDYDLSEPNRVKVRIFGKVIDEKYTRMLIARPDLDPFDVIRLDKVQKAVPLTESEFRLLKAKKLVEGRRPNLFVSAAVAVATDSVLDYLDKRGIDKAYCKKMVVDLLEKKGTAHRSDIDSLLRSKLSSALDESQKSNFIRNLLQEMRHEGTLTKIGQSRGPKAGWKLSSQQPEGSG